MKQPFPLFDPIFGLMSLKMYSGLDYKGVFITKIHDLLPEIDWPHFPLYHKTFKVRDLEITFHIVILSKINLVLAEKLVFSEITSKSELTFSAHLAKNSTWLEHVFNFIISTVLSVCLQTNSDLGIYNHSFVTKLCNSLWSQT